MSDLLKIDALLDTAGDEPTPSPFDDTSSAARYGPRTDTSGLSDARVLDVVRVLYRRRRTALTIFLLVFGAATVYTLTATPIYGARTRLLIETEQQNVVNFKQVVEEDENKADYYQTQYNILRSRALARRTLDALGLWNAPPFGGKSAGQGRLASTVAWMSTAIDGWFHGGGGAAPPAADETAAQWVAIDVFLSHLTVTPIRNSRLVDVTYELPDPRLGAAIVNTLTRNYIEQSLEYKFMASKEASDWLSARLTEQRRAVEDAEAKLQQYREQHDSISFTDRENITVQKLADLNAAVTRAKTERIQREATYRQLSASQSEPSRLDTFPAILTNTFIQRQKGELADLQQQYAQASERLGDKHPDMIKLKSAIDLSRAKLDTEISKVVQSVRSEYDSALAQETSLVAALDQQKTEAMSMNRKAIDYGVLERDLESNKQLYNNLLQRAKETGVAGELRTSNIRVVDPAEPPRSPVRPRRALNEVLAIVGGAFGACLLVFFVEYLDNRITSPDELSTHLGLAQLGLLPALEQLDGAYPLLSNGVPANFSEAFRSVRTNVLFSSTESGGRSIVITSTAPREGKSVVSSNLAIALAQAGQRVLLVDADMRRPKAHEIFGCHQEPGLSNVLVGSVESSDAIALTEVPGLWVLAAGRIPPNPAELLGSPRFRDFVRSQQARFDWTIIDTPPVMAVTDAALAAHQATGVLFVIGAEMTSRHTVKRAIDRLEQVGARFIGGVLNRVNLERNAYYYADYYRREYAQYYQKTTV